MNKVKVLLADDHDLFRKGLRRLLESEEEINVVGEARNGIEATEKARELGPDVVLMDIKMPKIDGIQATYQIKNDCPGAEVIVLSMYDDDEHLFRAIKAGARGYLMKSTSIREVVGAIKAASRGESLFNPTIARRILDEFAVEKSNGNKQDGHAGEDFFYNLTGRELEILGLLARAKTNRQIAKSLFIAEKTVKNHISNIYRKLQVNTRTEAMLKAAKLDLIDLQKPH
jgi:DNA-binding NarL/FixJ family response regulator